eukprot:scaffold289508_cov42-Tisochrysis_lutea.AAC.2
MQMMLRRCGRVARCGDASQRNQVKGLANAHTNFDDGELARSQRMGRLSLDQRRSHAQACCLSLHYLFVAPARRESEWLARHQLYSVAYGVVPIADFKTYVYTISPRRRRRHGCSVRGAVHGEAYFWRAASFA